MQIADDVDDALAGLAGCAPDLLVPNIGDPDGRRPEHVMDEAPDPARDERSRHGLLAHLDLTPELAPWAGARVRRVTGGRTLLASPLIAQEGTMDSDSHTDLSSSQPTSAMPSRVLGRTGRPVSVISLGTWQLGADWGEVLPDDARAVLEASVEAGVTMFDTADVYGDGRSEQCIAEFLAAHPELDTFVATKMGRRADQSLGNYSMANFRAWTDRSRSNLGTDTLDLVQLHCPPTEVIDSDQVFDDLDTLVAEGVMAAYGVSVETVDQALAAIARPSVASVQIIINAFRLKPLERVLPAALDAGVGIIARVPLASGLLSGRYDESTTFAADDHRSYNRHGEAFDRGETFSGVDYDEGVRAAREFSALAASRGLSPARAALAWVAQLDGVTTVIPGARSPEQARQNATAGSVPPLGAEFTAAVNELYDRRLKASVHDLW